MRIDDKNKVVVPDFVAEWFEETNDFYILGKMLDELESSKDERVQKWRHNCKGRHLNKHGNAQEVIAKMMMFGYTIEKPQKYYWRKKKEHLASFENNSLILLRSKAVGVLLFGNIATYNNSVFEAKFTEQEARELLKDDFNMFEKVGEN